MVIGNSMGQSGKTRMQRGITHNIMEKSSAGRARSMGKALRQEQGRQVQRLVRGK